MAGGKGTRISGMISDIPKPMIRVCGKPILEHQIEVLKKQEINHIILVVGHLKECIMEYFGDGSRIGVPIQYIIEEEPLGTAGALSYLRECSEDILLINGDIIFDVDIQRFYCWHKHKNADITLLTHPNDHPFDSTLIEVNESNKILRIVKKEEVRTDYENRVNAGVHMISPEVLKDFPQKPCKLDLDRDVINKYVRSGDVYAYDTTEYAKDMGTPERYSLVCMDYERDLISKRNISKQQKAVFLDRDGTINVEKGYISNRDQIELLPEAAEAIRRLNQSEYLVFVVTNQPVLARGECSFDEMKAIHRRLERLLGEEGAYVNGIFVCPHHPHKGFEGEIPELKIECACRKPKPGMLLQAAEKYNIDLKASYMIGDQERDIQAGRNAGCRTIYASSGLSNEVVDMILKGTHQNERERN